MEPEQSKQLADAIRPIQAELATIRQKLDKDWEEAEAAKAAAQVVVPMPVREAQDTFWDDPEWERGKPTVHLRDLAPKLGQTVTQLYEAARENRLPFQTWQDGNIWLVLKADVKRYLSGVGDSWEETQ